MTVQVQVPFWFAWLMVALAVFFLSAKLLALIHLDYKEEV